MNSNLIVFTITVILIPRDVITPAVESGPDNVVVLVGQTVELRCFRNARADQIHWFFAKGENQGITAQSAMTNYRVHGSGKGENWFFIDNIQLNQSGLYICRSDDGSFLPKAAHVVTVTHPPYCSISSKNQSAAVLDCWITCEGHMKVNMMWKTSEGQVIQEQNFTSSKERLSSFNLRVQTVMKLDDKNAYFCETRFMPDIEHYGSDEFAVNEPEFSDGVCQLSRETVRKAAMIDPSVAGEVKETNASCLLEWFILIPMAMLSLSVSLIILVLILQQHKICLHSRFGAGAMRNTCNGNGSSINNDNSSSISNGNNTDNRNNNNAEAIVTVAREQVSFRSGSVGRSPPVSSPRKKQSSPQQCHRQVSHDDDNECFTDNAARTGQCQPSVTSNSLEDHSLMPLLRDKQSSVCSLRSAGSTVVHD